jgi:hypothetical protein
VLLESLGHRVLKVLLAHKVSLVYKDLKVLVELLLLDLLERKV